MKLYGLIIAALITSCVSHPLIGQESPEQIVPVIDGVFDDWTDEYVIARDIPSSIKNGLTVKTLSAVRSGNELYIYFELSESINLQGGDPDESSVLLSVGTWLVFFFNHHRAEFTFFSSDERISWQDMGFECLPTYASRRFEMKLNPEDFDAQFKKKPASYSVGINTKTFEPHVIENPKKYAGEGLEHNVKGGSLRIANQNTFKNGLAVRGQREKFRRLFAAANADVYCFQEEWDQNKFNQGVAMVLPEATNTYWHSSCAIASKHQLTPLPMTLDRAAAAMITTDKGENVVVISAHFKCCGYSGSPEDDLRIQQAEQLVGEIKKMRDGEFGIEAKDAPVVLIGDYSLVGSRKPLDIINKAGLKDILCRANNGSACTWRGLNADEEYWPGRLDFVSVDGIEKAIGFILDSDRLSRDQLAKLSLKFGDSRASDHLMLVVDVKLNDK